MIKAEDIRIGDLVRVGRNCMFPENSVCIVTQINPERTNNEKKGVVTLSYADYNDDGPWGVWCDYIEGIPLTPAILEKNGFNIKDSEDSQKSYIKDIDSSPLEIPRRYLYIERRSLGWGLFIGIKGFLDSVMIRQIQYIHELQHILWAMGIDAALEI